MIHLQPKTLQGESVAKPVTPLLIICNIVCKSDIEEVEDYNKCAIPSNQHD